MVAPISPVHAPVRITEEQKFLFDVKGWLLLPAVLESSLLDAIKADLTAKARRAGAGKAVYRDCIEGPAQELIDHPSIVGLLQDLIAPDLSDEAYGFRCESSFYIYRGYGQSGFQPPHRGPTDAPFRYAVIDGRISSGLTRVVWELTEVRQATGGTPVMSGSHKAAFPVPPHLQRHDPALYEGYTCPAGSALIFTESCWHYGAEWTDADQRRLAVFNCYNHHLARFHRPHLTSDQIAMMPLKRQSAFRGVWAFDSHTHRFNSGVDDLGL